MNSQLIREMLLKHLRKHGRIEGALLLDGAWGSGKTHLAKEVISRINQAHKADSFLARTKRLFKSAKPSHGSVHVAYVSLIGIKNEAQFFDALVLAGLDASGSDGFRMAAHATRELASNKLGVSIPTTLAASKIRNVNFVIDDLERSEIPTKELLGLIHRASELCDSRVVVIGNAAELEQTEELSRVFEKFVWRTVHMSTEPELIQRLSEERINPLLEIAPGDALKDALRICIAAIPKPNIRALLVSIEQTIESIELLDNDLRANEKVVTSTLQIFLPTIYASRIGELDPNEDLKIVFQSHWAPPEKEGSERAQAFLSRWSNICDIRLLDHTVVKAVIERTDNASDLLIGALRNSRLFSVESLAEWQIVWHAPFVDASKFRLALDELEQKFAKREYPIIPPLLMHVFGLRFRMAEIAAIPLKPRQVMRECVKYLSDLEASKEVTVDFSTSIPRGFLDLMGYMGLGITCNEKPEMKVLLDKLATLMDRKIRDSYPEVSRKILQMMRTDPTSAAAAISGSEDTWGPIIVHPVFASAKSGEFVDALLAGDPEQQKELLGALFRRFDRSARQKELAPELGFIQSLRKEISQRTKSLAPNERERYRLFDAWYLGKIEMILLNVT